MNSIQYPFPIVHVLIPRHHSFTPAFLTHLPGNYNGQYYQTASMQGRHQSYHGRPKRVNQLSSAFFSFFPKRPSRPI